MALSVVSLGPVAWLGCIIAQAADNHARHGFGPGEQLVTSWHPGSPVRRCDQCRRRVGKLRD
jgi:hypothetical protein